MKLIKLAKKKGCTVERTGSCHWKITTPSGVTLITSFSPSTPGPHRDTIRSLLKAGVKL